MFVKLSSTYDSTQEHQPPSNISRKRDLSILIGNALDHFDVSLYSFLAPLLAPVLFPQYDFVIQLLLAYSVVGLSFLSEPLGVFLFGHLAQRRGPAFSLSFSLIGVAISTVLTGLLPGFNILGLAAPLGLVILRVARGIFGAGETTISRLYILEGKSGKKALRASYWYESSTMIGIVVASFFSMGVLWLNTLYPALAPYTWRACFVLGGVTGFFGYFLRIYAFQEEKHPIHSSLSVRFEGVFQTTGRQLWTHRSKLLQVAAVSSFSYLTYTIPFVFMNSFAPLVSIVSFETMISLNTALLVLDALLIPVIGRYTAQQNPAKVLTLSSLVLSVTILPLFYFLDGASCMYICFVRIWIVFWGIVFLCPLNYWYRQQFQGPEQYLLIGMGNAFGAATLGRLATPVCLWLWHRGGMIVLPALYITVVAILACLVVAKGFKGDIKKGIS